MALRVSLPEPPVACAAVAARLATGQVQRLSELSADRPLEGASFDLLLSLLGEALAEQADPDQPVERLLAHRDRARVEVDQVPAKAADFRPAQIGRAHV